VVLEYERSKEILQRHLPPAPADIGGGPGRDACWLADNRGAGAARAVIRRVITDHDP
jgi:hypothetical protein